MRIIQSANPRPLDLLALGPNGLIAAAGSTFGADGGVEVWDAGSGALRWGSAPDRARVESVAFTHSGRYLLLGGWGDNVLALADAELIRRQDDYALSWFRFAPAADGSRLLVGDSATCVGAAKCLATDGELEFHSLWGDGGTSHRWFDSFALSPDGRRAAFAEHSEFPIGRPARVLRFRDASTGTYVFSIPLAPADPIRQLAFTADGEKLLARTDSRTVRLFDATTGTTAGELVHPGRPFVTGVAVHPRGPVACARTNGTVTFWDPDTREQLRTFDWQAGKLVSVALSPDGALAAAGTEDGQIVVWDVDF
ncbi:MAG: WD40 repeat domain-containing protein [Gemmataceae bacterium]|nr:WD40 repeat domain-containing protein [Gemmataceae bacterium]